MPERRPAEAVERSEGTAATVAANRQAGRVPDLRRQHEHRGEEGSPLPSVLERLRFCLLQEAVGRPGQRMLQAAVSAEVPRE